MRLERAQNTEGRRDDVHEAIDGTKEEIGGSGAKARQVALEKSLDVRDVSSNEGWNGGLTPNSAKLSSGNLTGATSMKLNAFHCEGVSYTSSDRGSGVSY